MRETFRAHTAVAAAAVVAVEAIVALKLLHLQLPSVCDRRGLRLRINQGELVVHAVKDLTGRATAHPFFTLPPASMGSL
jgi:hypothetical protein